MLEHEKGFGKTELDRRRGPTFQQPRSCRKILADRIIMPDKVPTVGILSLFWMVLPSSILSNGEGAA